MGFLTSGLALAERAAMNTGPTNEAAPHRGSIVVVGGNGGMKDRYRAIAEERGLELRHFEQRIPNGTRKILGPVVAVIVIVGMVSHSLRDQAKSLVAKDAPVLYLRSASVSALRTAIDSLSAGQS
jgi:hypothetical protein